MAERPPSAEFNEAELQLIERLKTAEAAEAQGLVRAWLDEQEQRLRNENADARGTIANNLKLAKLLRAGGLLNEAYDTLEAVSTQAQLEGADDLRQEALDLMQETNERGG